MSRRALVGLFGAMIGMGLLTISGARSQPRPPEVPDPAKQRSDDFGESLHFAEESLARRVDEQMLFHRLEDLAEVDKVRYTGPPPRVIKNPTGQGAGNPVLLWAYTFIPKKPLAKGKRPLIVLVHGGVHGNFNPTFVHTLRELLMQGYAV